VSRPRLHTFVEKCRLRPLSRPQLSGQEFLAMRTGRPGRAWRTQNKARGVLLLRRLNRSEVLVQLLLIRLLECATIRNVMDVVEG
jgi:hypothetical protein